MTYDEMVCTAAADGISVMEKPLAGNDGRILGSRIAIRKDIETTTEKSCVLAEELGHYYTSYGTITDQAVTSNRKQEYRARLYGYNIKIGLKGLVDAYEAGCRNLSDICDYLDVTEDYLRSALACYRSKYGRQAVMGNYVICFEPCLAVGKI
ncbi:MAG: hypothetical protein Q4D60_12240 [Eubacteriales bacterium]|nr:hypothetical protein [Eubacteriales bacterium]